MKSVTFTLESGTEACFFLSTNFVVTKDLAGAIKIADGIHNHSGWTLAKKYKFEEVIFAIRKD